MIRLIGVDLPKNKRIVHALRSIYGIGLTLANKFVQKANIDTKTRTNELTTEQTIELRRILENCDIKLVQCNSEIKPW